MSEPDTTPDAIRRLCDALIRDDFAYGSDRLNEIIAHADALAATLAASEASRERWKRLARAQGRSSLIPAGQGKD